MLDLSRDQVNAAAAARSWRSEDRGRNATAEDG